MPFVANGMCRCDYFRRLCIIITYNIITLCECSVCDSTRRALDSTMDTLMMRSLIRVCKQRLIYYARG